MKILLFLNRISTEMKRWWPIYLYLLVYLIAFSLVVVHRFWQYETFYFNHGIFDESFWQFSRGKAPIFDHLGVSNRHQLADHFTPTLYLLTPLYWLTNRYEPLLLVGPVAATLTTYVIHLFTRLKTKNKLMSLAIPLAFSLFIGLQNALISNFNPSLISLLTLALTVYSFETKRYVQMWFWFILTLGVKETEPPVMAIFSLYLIYRKQFTRGFFGLFLCVATYYLVTRWLIPTVFNQPYFYFAATHDSLSSAFFSLFDQTTKRQVWLVSFATFGLLPLAAIAFLPVILIDFVIRFILSTGSARWDLGMHYNLLLSVSLAIGAVYGLTILKKTKWYPRFETWHAMLIILVALGLNYKLHGPINLAFNQAFYPNTQNHQFLNNFLSHIPSDTSVMTMNNLAPHLTHTNKVYLLRENHTWLSPDIIALDLRPGQNQNNFWPLRENSTQSLYQQLLETHHYTHTEISPNQHLFTKAHDFN